MEDFLVNYEIIVAEEPAFKKGSTAPEEIDEDCEVMVAVHIVQVVDEDDDVLVGCTSCRFQGEQLMSVAGQIVIPKRSIRHRATLELVDGPPEQPRELEEDPEIPEGVDATLYTLTPEERRYRGYQ
ncbi:MAG: hypothetical protein Unbinned767contig1000_44 [Prokaryotic dsDNA virus sp.]|nr:MAG: hypothetical protein Unbinned767contig1000_44 [Prokaryotic dsDNA virus sp.]|tara:strand:+ start:39134 stop:39511 length:378 start_codon:yes stop_codon:yes gene_type:complete